MKKITLFLPVFLAGCVSAGSVNTASVNNLPPAVQLSLLSNITIPAGSTHMRLHAGGTGKSGLYEPYCRLDMKAALNEEKQVKAGNYVVTSSHHSVVQDDLLSMPVMITRVVSSSLLDEENVFSMLTLKLSGPDPRLSSLRCYQEYTSYYDAVPMTLQTVGSLIAPLFSLSMVKS